MTTFFSFKPEAPLVLALTLLAACCVPARAATPLQQVWTGRVVYVVDGDTVHVRPPHGGKPVSVRVHGIDAPEICQNGGGSARDALRRRALGQQVVVHGVSRDDYGRLLAQLVLDGDDLGGAMVEAGQAWSYRYRGRPGPYAAQQRRAQAAGRGLFRTGGEAPVYPAVFRKAHGSCRS
ncbi:MAG: nuclease [Polaromonas sp. 39-63-203]|uniref:thermonuclease family protein n=1 Tax=Polaromonas sp. TaxID=1869339 RepID=UPI000BD48672|nr:thermonuclease family protein [Polaromonas sp.]OYY51593.1 MAG: nuclease [Polaromonas sp. 35-63-240]OYY94652.1 MAG: nuclease [Polaromonas sp. 28-63-22]OYZ83080.1 MAG: nuclease [Polaromonas sp. 24-62-144]OZA96443.1 MAG: nuclease [Polaromonas sp. 39-63-203]HQS33604.1 thermonuclease family protein [Polaromonas sp.]